MIDLDDDHVTLATGLMPGDDRASLPPTHITFVRKAIGSKVTPPAPDAEPPAVDDDRGDGEGDVSS